MVQFFNNTALFARCAAALGALTVTASPACSAVVWAPKSHHTAVATLVLNTTVVLPPYWLTDAIVPCTKSVSER